MREQQVHFCRENYLAVVILLVIGARKGELISLRWDEIDFEKRIWFLSAEKSKNDYPIAIPLPALVIECLQELKTRSHPSEYAFPSRRASKRRNYISDDTLNHALTNLFGRKTGKLSSSTGNVLGEAGIEYFTIHDIRRSARTIMGTLKVPPWIAEKAINHVKKDIYDQYAYFSERSKAHSALAESIKDIV
jgi:integrase